MLSKRKLVLVPSLLKAFVPLRRLVLAKPKRKLLPWLSVVTCNNSDDDSSPRAVGMTLLATGALGLSLFLGSGRTADNLGVAAVVGDDAESYLLHAVEEISNGKSNCEVGIATASRSAKLEITKFGPSRGSDESKHWLPESFDCVVVLRNNTLSSRIHTGHKIGVASAKESNGADMSTEAIQPQTDHKHRIAVVYEGQIANHRELQRELEVNKKIQFRTNSHAELIANMIGCYMDDGLKTAEAAKETLSRLDGTWSVIVMDKEMQDEVIVSQNGSQLGIGIGDGKMYIATEPECFRKYTNRYISLQDGEFAIVRKDNQTLDLSRTEQLPFNRRTTQSGELGPAPFKHWTLSDICEQPESLARATGCGTRIAGDTVVLGGLDRNADQMLSIQHLTMAAQGSSLFAAEYGARIMMALGAFETVQTVQSQNINKRMIASREGGACVLSKTGESKVSQTAVKTAKKTDYPVFSIVNSVGSQVAKMTKVGVYLNAGEEFGPISTKIFSSQVMVLGLIASWFAQYRPSRGPEVRLNLIRSMNRAGQCFATALETRSTCKAAAHRLFNAKHCFIVGNSFGESVAKEGAFLLSMLANVNAEGCTPGLLRHSSLSLIDGAKGGSNRTPVIILILSENKPDEMRIIAEQVRASGAFTLIITDDESLSEGISDMVVTIPKNGMLTALNAVVPLQLLAYELSVLKGINPDRALEGIPPQLLRYGSLRHLNSGGIPPL